MKYLVIIVILTVVKQRFVSQNICLFGCEDKCLGVMGMDNGIPKEDADLFSSRNTSNYDECANLCQIDVQCFMAAFVQDNKTCNMYRKISCLRTSNEHIKLFLWNCCNTNSSYEAANRCPGFWRSKLQSRSDNMDRTGDPLVELKGINQYECRMQCLKNPICGAVNTLKQDIINSTVISCQLIIQFPVEYLQFVDDDRWETFQWQCAHNYSLPTPSSDCVHRVDHARGYWNVENTSMILSNDIKHLLYFHTFDYRQCTLNCALYPNCKRAWYSSKSFFCVLEAVKYENCSEKTEQNDYSFTTYVWKICSSQNHEEVTVESKASQCMTLVDNKWTYIYPIKCGHSPRDNSSLYRCWINIHDTHGTEYSHYLHCQSNQSFLVFDKLDPPPNFIPYATWQRVFTGYESFWLVNVTESSFITSDNSACATFDASMDVSNIPPPTIIKKTQWFPRRPLGPLTPFPKHPVKYVIISDTERPFCNCFSVEACSATMRLIDVMVRPILFSLAYNFVVTGDGTVYEARGWDLQPAVTNAKYNPNSVAFALCGRYFQNPGVAALTSVKQLIKMAVDLNKVDKNYTMYIYNDIMDSIYPYEGLRQVIELWPHYRGHLVANCRQIKSITIVINALSILVSSLLIVLFYEKFVCTIWHKKDCNLVRTCGIETVYSNICDTSVDVLPMIIMYNVKYLLLEDKYVSPLTSSIFWIEDRLPICESSEEKCPCCCQSAVFSFFNLCRLQSKLVNVGSITLLPEVCNCQRVISFIFQRNSELEKESLLIVHPTNVRLFHRFMNQLYRNKCVCNNFYLTQYSTHSQNFYTVFNISGAVTSLNKGAVSRSHLEDMYTFVDGPEDVLRYY